MKDALFSLAWQLTSAIQSAFLPPAPIRTILKRSAGSSFDLDSCSRTAFFLLRLAILFTYLCSRRPFDIGVATGSFPPAPTQARED